MDCLEKFSVVLAVDRTSTAGAAVEGAVPGESKPQLLHESGSELLRPW